MTNYELAYAIAERAHFGQVDKAGKMYILHPLTVSHNVCSDVAKVVGLLHDVAEDSNIGVPALRVLFGDEVADALECLTHGKNESYEAYIRRIATNKVATEVKIADLNHNMDLSRLPFVSEVDVERVEKYRKARKFLLSL